MLKELKLIRCTCVMCSTTQDVFVEHRMAALDELFTLGWECASDRDIWCPACCEKADAQAESEPDFY